jgi:hypothetical protein
MTTTDNPLDLGLTKDEDIFVRDTALTIYRVSYLNSLDNAIQVARAIGIIRHRFHGQGIRKGFNAALIAYGYTSRDGTTAIDAAIRSQLRELLAEENEVRAWWFGQSDKCKRRWLSPSSIHRQFKKWKRRGLPQPKHSRGAALADQLAVARDEIADLKEQLASVHTYIGQLESELGGSGSRVQEATWISPVHGEKRHWVLNWQQRNKTEQKVK